MVVVVRVVVDVIVLVVAVVVVVVVTVVVVVVVVVVVFGVSCQLSELVNPGPTYTAYPSFRKPRHRYCDDDTSSTNAMQSEVTLHCCKH